MAKTVQTRINNLRKRLPYAYRALVAKKTKTLTERTVKCVFEGSITDPKKVERVLAAAEKVADDYQSQLKKLAKPKQAKRTDSVN